MKIRKWKKKARNISTIKGREKEKKRHNSDFEGRTDSTKSMSWQPTAQQYQQNKNPLNKTLFSSPLLQKKVWT